MAIRDHTPEQRVAVKAQIVHMISEGIPLRVICRMDGMPGWVSVYNWIDQDEDFAQRFARARDLGADAIASEALEIMDEHPERDEKGRLDPAQVQWQKNRAELRLKLLAKWSPKKYGDKITTDVISSDGSMSPAIDAKKLSDGALAELMAARNNEPK